VRQIFQVGIGLHWGALTMALAITTIVALLAGTAACVRTLRFQPAAALRGE
jgi:ABC-type lipoprotein release transport system permease subunit